MDGVVFRAAVHVVDRAAPDHLSVFGRLRVVVPELIGRVVGRKVAHAGIGADVFVLHAGPHAVAVLVVDAVAVALIEAVKNDGVPIRGAGRRENRLTRIRDFAVVRPSAEAGDVVVLSRTVAGFRKRRSVWGGSPDFFRAENGVHHVFTRFVVAFTVARSVEAHIVGVAGLIIFLFNGSGEIEYALVLDLDYKEIFGRTVLDGGESNVFKIVARDTFAELRMDHVL